jgi:hypothetical protein
VEVRGSVIKEGEREAVRWRLESINLEINESNQSLKALDSLRKNAYLLFCQNRAVVSAGCHGVMLPGFDLDKAAQATTFFALKSGGAINVLKLSKLLYL